ncbi:MAG: TerC family protein [Beijerinckiaceae bacterium]
MTPEQVSFVVAFLEIIWIDLILSGDNAIVIALACRALPAQQRTRGIVFGSGAAVALRIIFTFIFVKILALPFVRLAGGLLLLWIAIKLAVEGEGEEKLAPAKSIWAAVRTIVVADALMSLDNVVAVAAAAKGSLLLVAFGTLLTVPLIIFGSTLLINLFVRYPILVWAGAALLGFIGGQLIGNEPYIANLLADMPTGKAGAFVAMNFEVLCGLAGAIFVLAVALLLRSRAKPKR